MTAPQIRPDVLCQQALERVLTYLGDDGVALTAATCRQALRLVESVIVDEIGPDLPARCVDLIPDYFERPAEVIPDASPPLQRGCIGYE